ncbi:KRAB-A domain-containing protein 2 [Trichonephila clavipes]|nr:KRAB-A domain-containing protein 2 [Trichonephila clavipes]
MDTGVNRDLFLEKLSALIAGKRGDNWFYFSKEKYSKILSEVVFAKAKWNTPLDYRRLKHFHVLKINDEEKLIVPLKPGEKNIQYYVTNDELFSVLYGTHIRTGHRGRTPDKSQISKPKNNLKKLPILFETEEPLKETANTFETEEIANTFETEEQLKETANTFETEEQLEKIANTFETEEQLKETGNTSEKNKSGGHTENHIPKKNIPEDLQSTFIKF